MYKTVIRPAMMHGAETWAAKKTAMMHGAETWAAKCTRP